MLMYPKNEEIARRYFMALILDNDGYFLGRIHATSRADAIEKFNLYEIERG